DLVDAGLGRATKALLESHAWKAAAIALDVLGERALFAAHALVPKLDDGTLGPTAPPPEGDAAFGKAPGAFMAPRWLAMQGETFSAAERAKLLTILTPLAEAPAARELELLMIPATALPTG